MREIPESLKHGPFTTHEALDAGVTPRMLRGARFNRLHRGVYVHADYALTFADLVRAAQLALPPDAHLTHVSRIRILGLDWRGDDRLHFVVARDHHITPTGIFLHRTDALPPTDGVGVSPAAAFVAMCATESLIDLIAIGDWLLHRGHMTVGELTAIARSQGWRAGAAQSLAVRQHLDGRSASIEESRLRVMLRFAGLPAPELNVPLFDGADSPIVDMLFRPWRVVVEYEGRHHFKDAEQMKRDIWRYAEMRRVGVEYVQVFDRMMATPKAVVLRVHTALLQRGYDGPDPRFDGRWESLFAPVRRPAPTGQRASRVGAVG
jgi:very-short-patch-repair endonuclease